MEIGCSTSANGNFLKAILCKQCCKYLYGPIKFCTNCNLTMCPECHNGVKSCPRCRSRKSRLSRCVGTDRILDEIAVPCPYKGCDYIDKTREIRKHVDTCVSKLKLCPLRMYNRCAWVGSSQEEVVAHCKAHHTDKIFSTEEKLLKCAGFRTNYKHILKCDIWVMFDVFNELFRLYYTVDYTNGYVIFIVCYGGATSASDKQFHFEVTFYKSGDRSGGKKRQLTYKAPCELIDHQKTNFDYFIVENCDFLHKYCTGDDLYFNVKICCS